MLLLTSSKTVVLCLVSLAVFDHVRAADGEGDSDDWNNANIAWESEWDVALERASKEDKPILLLIHKHWCSACQTLRPKLSGSKAFEDASKDVVMIKVTSDIDDSIKFQPDGGYFPRILFYSSDGNLLSDVKTNRPQYLYFHSGPDTVVSSIAAAIEANKGIKQKGEGSKTEL